MNAAISARKTNIIPPNSAEEILRIRLQGTWEDLEVFSKILLRQKGIEITSCSKCYLNKGTERIYRKYADIKVEKSMRNEKRGKRNGKGYSNRKQQRRNIKNNNSNQSGRWIGKKEEKSSVD